MARAKGTGNIEARGERRLVRVEYPRDPTTGLRRVTSALLEV
jgi:hypothetical protein